MILCVSSTHLYQLFNVADMRKQRQYKNKKAFLNITVEKSFDISYHLIYNDYTVWLSLTVAVLKINSLDVASSTEAELFLFCF